MRNFTLFEKKPKVCETFLLFHHFLMIQNCRKIQIQLSQLYCTIFMRALWHENCGVWLQNNDTLTRENHYFRCSTKSQRRSHKNWSFFLPYIYHQTTFVVTFYRVDKQYLLLRINNRTAELHSSAAVIERSTTFLPFLTWRLGSSISEMDLFLALGKLHQKPKETST